MIDVAKARKHLTDALERIERGETAAYTLVEVSEESTSLSFQLARPVISMQSSPNRFLLLGALAWTCNTLCNDWEEFDG